MDHVRDEPDDGASDERETIKAIQGLDLLVVVDVIPGEMAVADVVLPNRRILERYDDLNPEIFASRSSRCVSQSYVAARSEAELWIARELARKLGLERSIPGRPSRSMSITG